jgi:NDP-sugar pyrophosphorylase family protein
MSEHTIQAVILAGGAGARLKPYTEHLPKPLVPIEGVPILEIVLRQLVRFDFRRVVITVGHEADLIRANFSQGAHLGLELSYAQEENPLGTAGPLAGIDNLSEHFLVLNGDLLTTLNLREFFEAHRRAAPVLTIAAHERKIPVEFGIIKGANQIVDGYVEKPVLRYLVSMGVYAFHRRILSYLTPGKRLDFPDLVHRLLAQGEDIHYYPFDGYWLDIGCKSDYEKAIEDFEFMRDKLLGLDGPEISRDGG